MRNYTIFAHEGHDHAAEAVAESSKPDWLMLALGAGAMLLLLAIIGAWFVYRHRVALKHKAIQLVRATYRLLLKYEPKIGRLHKIVLPLLISVALGLLLLVIWFAYDGNIAVLNPKGTIATDQYNLLVFTSLLSLIIIVPVFALTFHIVRKYRIGNTKAKAYTPDWDGSRVLETIWWIIPLILISILGVIIWQSSHRLDPYRPLTSSKKPVTVQVVALEWKWLFIYPEQKIATVNYVQFPEDTPVNFRITADAPMNSFWIPQLGGQVYAMAGMETKLHLSADEPGIYKGASANLSGEGFAGMKFQAVSSTQQQFDDWVASVKKSESNLDQATYDKLVKPSKNNQPAFYTATDEELYDTIIMNYMTPEGTKNREKEEHGSHQ